MQVVQLEQADEPGFVAKVAPAEQGEQPLRMPPVSVTAPEEPAAHWLQAEMVAPPAEFV
jgi:hypothetical protein